MLDTVWVALASLVQPAGLLETATVAAVILLVALWVRLLTTFLDSARKPVLVHARAARDVRPRSTNWDADAPGRPQPRAPGCGSTLG